MNINPAPTSTSTRPVSGPVVIARAFHAVLQNLGFFMGKRLNGAGDAMDFEPFLDQWINPLISMNNRLDYSLKQTGFWQRQRIRRGFDRAFKAFSHDRPHHQPWGWKNPRSMYILPIIADRVPDFRFLHVVRDGRDMALSDNQNQRRKHFQAMFGPQTSDRDTAEASANLWSMANIQAADWGESTLQNRYLRIRLEDICAAPEPHITEIANWLELPDTKNRETAIRLAAATIRPPASLGRWQQTVAEDQALIENAARPALSKFGYLEN